MIRHADISEFQLAFDGNAYLHAGYKCLIVRAHNGARPDKLWPARRDYVRGLPFVAVGYYQYLMAGRDAAQQARDFIACVGQLKPNEFAVCDCEEGSGSQVARVEAWFKLVDAWAGFPATLYSGDSFAQTNLGGWARWASRPRWLASYRLSEPSAPHDLWQNTDKARFPGLAGTVDGNIFQGTDAQYLTTMRRGATPAPPAGAIRPGENIAVRSMPDGRLEVFELAATGEVFHRWNDRAGGWVDRWESLGKPGS